eukprot:CAMPEP_0119474414 /NCGR_PEP_ID=MMETSP1344-20130328/5672_1 /TAXON_ID=236787 /ORGANISM="Florenciella parvula, Strain CCMP2471" /LENGTH=124 /DNA_ID=CAMNT_0007507697 /DNA_START=253 /DNA_END=628 /DNA_ORIENTATION=-
MAHLLYVEAVTKAQRRQKRLVSFHVCVPQNLIFTPIVGVRCQISNFVILLLARGSIRWRFSFDLQACVSNLAVLYNRPLDRLGGGCESWLLRRSPGRLAVTSTGVEGRRDNDTTMSGDRLGSVE